MGVRRSKSATIPYLEAFFNVFCPPDQAPAGSRDIPGSRDWTKIPIPGLLKIKSRDFLGFGKAQKTMFSKTFIGFQTTLESFGDSKSLSKSI